jgi:signal transduction histidine kinase
MQPLLDAVNILQTMVLALSIFNLIALLWLAFTVWLNGDRRTLITRVGIIGISLSALFFFIHTLLLDTQLSSQAHSITTPNFLWHLMWLPAFAVPYLWLVIGLHYASLINEGWRRRRPLLLLCSGLLGMSILLLLALNRETFTFEGTLGLLAYSDAILAVHAVTLLSPLVILPVLFLCYVTFCAIGPWLTLSRLARLLRVLWEACLASHPVSPLHRRLANVFWDDPVEVELLEEPVLSWHLARPGLLVAALLMVTLTISLGGLAVYAILNWLKMSQHVSITKPVVVPTYTTLPANLLLPDLLANGLVGFTILLIGYSIVRHGILIERPLGRRGFFDQWRGIVIVATIVAIFIALLVAFTRSSLVGLLLITSLATAAYALFTWSSHSAHDRYVALLAPFLRSTNMRHWLNTDVQKTEQSMQDLFFHLCKHVLEVECARLVVLAGPVRRSFTYRWPASNTGDEQCEGRSATAALPHTFEQETHPVRQWEARRVRLTLQGQALLCWVLPIYDELGLVAALYLGPRQDGGVFTNEDMELAHACGQRILDTLRDHESMQAVASLLRRRIVHVKLLGAQHRRTLHDEILPQIHLALLHLETLRPLLSGQQQGHATQGTVVFNEAVRLISDAHRGLAAMMRSTTPSTPHHLERDGIMHAIRTMVEQDFQHAFDEVEWAVSEQTVFWVDEVVPPALAEIIFAAVQETLRNAARHARGTDVHRRLRLVLKATCNPHLEIIVADDGIGIVASNSATTGTGEGLLTYSALLAIAGGSLTVKSTPGEGVIVRILLPEEALR